MNLKPRRAEEPEINLISLIDVLLMMVIFFMVSSTFVDENRLRIRLPEACANVCFGGPKRNRLFMTASQSIYAIYVNTQGATPG